MADRRTQPPPGRLSNATFWSDGTELQWSYWRRLDSNPRWPLMAGWKKTGIAGTAAVAGVTTAWELFFHLSGTERILAGVLGLGIGGAFLRGVHKLDELKHYRDVIEPLHAAALAAADHPPSIRPRDWLEIPADVVRNELAVSVIHVPATFTGDERDLDDLKRAYAAKTGIEAPEVKQLLRGRDPRLEFRQSRPPPLSVSLEDIRPYIDRCSASQVVLGIDIPRDPLVLDFDSETPMAAFSGTTGAGKSEFAKNVAAQLLYHGAIAIILDYKLISHMWADGLPNVAYARTPEEIHHLLWWLAIDEYDDDGNKTRICELTRRKEALLAAKRAGVTPDVGPRMLLLAEERNATNRVLKRLWRRMGGKGPSPALEGVDETGETGRQLCVNVLYIAQRLSAKAAGSDGTRDATENIGAVVTWDPTPQTWKLIGNDHAQPPSSGHKGRYHFITRSGVRTFQGVLYDKDPDKSDVIARELAMSGTVGVPPAGMPCVWRPALPVPAAVGQIEAARQEGAEQAFGVHQDPGVLPAGGGPGGAVTLAELVAAGLVVSIGAARKLPKRHGWEPVVRDDAGGHKYAIADVHKYLQAKGKR